MDTLTAKIEGMLNGEAKRRIIAEKWLSEVEEELLEIALTLWGSGEIEPNKNTKTVTDSTFKNDGIYFRYQDHFGEKRMEYTGFYFTDGYMNVWGTPIEEVKGANFWYAIQKIYEWIPQVCGMMDTQMESREALLSKLNCEN